MSQGAQTFFEYFGRIQVGFWENSSWHLGEFKMTSGRIILGELQLNFSN